MNNSDVEQLRSEVPELPNEGLMTPERWREVGDVWPLTPREQSVCQLLFETTTADLIINTAGFVHWLGHSVSVAGDVNGDGFDDLTEGGDGELNSKPNAGEASVVSGSPSLAGVVSLASLPSPIGFPVFGVNEGDFSGRSVSGAGDVNGDGFDDFLIGAEGFDNPNIVGVDDVGATYWLFGSDLLEAVTYEGTSAAETLTGDTSANVMVGGRGDDIVQGLGGADVLRGGTGFDTLRLDASGIDLDLLAIPDNRMLGIEQIDITGSGSNTLSLNSQEVLNISDESNTLMIRKDADDTVNIGAGWTQDSNETIGGDTFEVYSQGQSVLRLQAESPDAITFDNGEPGYAEVAGSWSNSGLKGQNNSSTRYASSYNAEVIWQPATFWRVHIVFGFITSFTRPARKTRRSKSFISDLHRHKRSINRQAIQAGSIWAFISSMAAAAS